MRLRLITVANHPEHKFSVRPTSVIHTLNPDDEHFLPWLSGVEQFSKNDEPNDFNIGTAELNNSLGRDKSQDSRLWILKSSSK